MYIYIINNHEKFNEKLIVHSIGLNCRAGGLTGCTEKLNTLISTYCSVL